MLGILTGILSGIVSGMGIGGGVILIPALITFFYLEQKTAQGINLVYFLPTAAVALFIHIKNKNADIKTAALIGAFGILGAAGGSLIALRINDSILQRLFGIFLLFIGIREIVKGVKSKV